MLVDRSVSGGRRRACRRVETLRITTHEGNLSSGAGKLNRRGVADAAGGACDHDESHEADFAAPAIRR